MLFQCVLINRTSYYDFIKSYIVAIGQSAEKVFVIESTECQLIHASGIQPKEFM